MKNMMVYLAAAMVSFSVQMAKAELTGRWTGDGQYNDNGQTEPAEGIDVSIAHSAQQITFSDESGWTLLPESLDIQGTDLLYDGDVVGSINGDNMELKLMGQNFSCKVSLSKINSDNVSYQDSCEISDGTMDALSAELANTPAKGAHRSSKPVVVRAIRR